MRKDANIPRPHLRTDFTGRRYGRLVAIAPDAPGKWRYLCDCGNECVKSSSVVVQGSTSSCGCFRRESATKVCMSRVKTGLSRHWSWETWRGIMRRCYSEKFKDFRHYGGRGITVCDHIRRGGPKSIIDLLGDRPIGMSVDRIDNDSGYFCGKCFECASKCRNTNMRWATQRMQVRNSRASSKVELRGRVMTIMEISEEFGLPYGTLHMRWLRGKRGESLIAPFRRLTNGKYTVSIA